MPDKETITIFNHGKKEISIEEQEKKTLKTVRGTNTGGHPDVWIFEFPTEEQLEADTKSSRIKTKRPRPPS